MYCSPDAVSPGDVDPSLSSAGSRQEELLRDYFI